MASHENTLPTFKFFVAHYPSAAVFINPSYTIDLASDKFCLDFNLQPSQLVGHNIFEVFRDHTLIPDADTLRSVIDFARSSGDVHITQDVRGVDGTFWSIRSCPIIEQGCLRYDFISIHDNTKARNAQQALINQMEAADSYQILVEQAKDYAIFILDPVGNVKTWNIGAQILKGYAKEEIVGKHFSVFYLPDDVLAAKPRKELDIALREGRVEDESFRVKKDGTTFWANVVITPMYRDGRHIGFSKVTRDLTEYKAANQRVIDAYKESEQLKSDFLANMSHEIRTPLHGILGNLNMLTTDDLPKEQRDLVEAMKTSGRFLTYVIGGILDYSKLEANRFQLVISDDLNLHHISNAVKTSLKYMAKPGVLFLINCAANIPEHLRGDSNRFQQVLQNLASNALKFTEKGSVLIDISIQSEEGHSFTILTTVTDTGIGISEKDSGALFQRFSQIDASRTKSHEGTGLGLAISKGIVELMGGNIKYAPNPNVTGSIFSFTVILDKVLISTPMSESEDAMSLLSLSIPSLKAELKGIAPRKRLLLAEDNDINRMVALRILRKLGFPKVDVVLNGAEAVEKAKENKLVYDAILMDISMPVMDGKMATKEIRLAGIGTPIIALTANALKSDLDGYIEIGMNAAVSKPVNTDMLVEALLQWLK